MKNFILILLCLSGIHAAAQNSVQVNVVVPPPYSPYLHDYTQFEGKNIITLTNKTAQTLQVKLTGSLTGEDNGLYLFTKPEYKPAMPIVLSPYQTYTLMGGNASKDFFTDKNTETNVSDKQRNTIITSGILPEGNYKLCIRAVDYLSNVPYSPDDPAGCTHFSVSYPIPPILLNPACGSTVQNPYPAFNWSPVLSSGSFFVYDLYILKMLPTQIPDDAMWLAISGNVGNPIVITNLQAPTYQYMPYNIPLEDGQTYAWCVVARDITGKLLVTNKGRSEVCLFSFQKPVATNPVSPQEKEEQKGTPSSFNLNNTSISGKLLYRYYQNEQPGDPGIPAYNANIIVYEQPKNREELNQMQPAASGTIPNNSGVKDVIPGKPIVQTEGYLNSQPALGNATGVKGKIGIDPAVRYLYANTLPVNGGEPLHQTGISLYLEYVAVKRVMQDQTSYFQVVPGKDAVFNRSTAFMHDGYMDPQLEYAMQMSKDYNIRALGSELIASTTTDADGNFSFHFDQIENTGLLDKGPVTLSYLLPIDPDKKKEKEFINPQDLVTNPADIIGQHFENIMGGGGDPYMFGNPMLQGNKGWGNNQGGLMDNMIPGNQLEMQNSAPFNNQMNKQLNKGGPAPFDSDEFDGNAGSDIWMNYTVNYLFKVLRIKVNDPYYCHPDILIFSQPGDQVVLPPIATFVNSFNAEITVLAGGKKTEDPFLAPGQPISNFKVNLGRKKSAWEGRPENFPLHEGMDIKPVQYISISGNTPYFLDWNKSEKKPGQLKLVAEGMSASNGKILMQNLVINKNILNGDGFFFEIVYPQTSIYNYSGSWGSFYVGGPAEGGSIYQVDSRFSYSFRPYVHKQEVKLEPLNPEILLRTVTKSNIETAPLPDVDVFLLEYNKGGNTYTYSQYKTGKTDQNGYQRFSNLSMELNPAGGLINPYRRIMLNKQGYKIQYKPVDTGNPGSDQDYYQPIKKGQRLDLNEIIMKGGAQVYGYVKDEFDNPVTALVKIGDGPFLMTSNVTNSDGYDSKIHDNANPAPGSSASYLPNFQLFELIDAGTFNKTLPTEPIQTNNTASGTPQIGGMQFSSTSYNALKFRSRFTANAPTGSKIRVIVIPMSESYFPDTFYVDINSTLGALNLGTFKVYEKVHRVSIHVVKKGAGVASNLSNALVEVGETSGITNQQGRVNLRISTPDSYFKISVKGGNHVPIEEYRYLPISKNYTLLEYAVDPGRTVNGTVSDKQSGKPIEGARVYVQTGFTEYGPSLVQAFSDAEGKYTLTGVPLEFTTIYASKSGSSPTYVGGTRFLSSGTNPPPSVDFVLNPLSDIRISKLFGFQVEISELQEDLVSGQYKCSGAFVHIPAHGDFKAYTPETRIRFNGIQIRKSQFKDSLGIPLAEPVENEAKTMESKIRLRVFNQFIADLKSDRNDGLLPVIRVVKRGETQGAFQGHVLTDLESFRFSFNYTGQIYVSPATDKLSMNALVSDPSDKSNAKGSYFVMNKGFRNSPKDMQFTVHDFKARADRSKSTMDAQAVRLATRLYPNLQMAGEVVVEAGFIAITPHSIQIENEGHPISFKLEQWEVKSVNGWDYSIPHGGILIPKALIKTQMVDIPTGNLILRPNQLIMPADLIDLSNLSLGGGVTKLHQYSNTEALLNFDPACSYDLGPHWRFSIYRKPSELPACYLSGLPGFESGDKIDIGSFTLYSNNSTLVQPIQQSRKFYNVVDFQIQNIINTKDAVEIAGALMTGIPGVTPPTAVMEYTRQAGQVIRKTKAMDLVLETPGKVFFNGLVGTEHYVFKPDYFEANGALVFENDDPNDNQNIKLKGKLVKNSSGVNLYLPKLADNNTDAAFQYIPLANGSTRLKVLSGLQSVVGNSWNTMRYTAELVGAKGLQDATLDYVVSGAVEVDASSGNSLKISNIETPLGGMNMVFDWEAASFLGSLSFNVPIQMGAVEVSNGMFECMFSGRGFYFDMLGKVGLPGGLSKVLNVNTGFLTGDFKSLPATVLKRHQQIMYLGQVPDYIQNAGISGVYINANASPSFANWSVSVPLPAFSVGFGVSAGVDFNFLTQFSSAASVMTMDAVAYAKAWAGVDVLVCSYCVGALAQFLVNGTLTFAPKADLSFNACSSFTLFGDFCGVETSKDIGCHISASASNGLDIDVQWSACGGAASKKASSCDF